jgi:CHAT domain-containing protein/Tfp pilus assembly protein PilF
MIYPAAILALTALLATVGGAAELTPAPDVQTPGPQALADQLIDAPSESDRAALLSSHPDIAVDDLETALVHAGEHFRGQGNFAKAEVSFGLVRQLAERNQQPARVADALRNSGIDARLQQRYSEALEDFRATRAIAEQIGDQSLIARAEGGIGAAAAQSGDYDTSLAAFNHARQIAESIGDRAQLGRVLANLGIVAQNQGDLAAAHDYIEQSLQIERAEKFPDSDIATLFLNLGVIAANQGDNARALANYRDSLRLLGDSDSTQQAILLNDIAMIYRSQGQYAQTVDYAHRALALSERIGNREEIASAHGTLASASADQDRLLESLQSFKQSLAIYQDIGNKRDAAYTLGALGDVLARLHRYNEAQEALEQARDLGRSLHLQAITAQSLLGLARLRYRQHRFREALLLAEGSAESLDRTEYRGSLWLARTVAGQSWLALGKRAEARQAFEDAIANIEALRDRVAGGQESQTSFFSGAMTPYHAMVGLLVAENRPREALLYAERAKGRALLDILTAGKADLTRSMSATEREREKRLEIDLTSLNRRIQFETARPTADQGALPDLRKQLQRTRLSLQDFESNLYAAHPELKVQRGQVAPVSSGEIGEIQPDSHAATLEYVVTEERTYLFVVTRPARVQVYTLNLSARDLEKRVVEFREQLAGRNLEVRGSSVELFRRLLSPAWQELSDKSTLLIVPDGSLWDLPFQALLEDSDRYLIEDHTVAYAPSLSVLREMERLHTRNRAREATSGEHALLVFADPDLGKTPSSPAPLPEARREAEALQALYGTASSIHVGAEARESTFKSEAGQFRILHLATHGLLDDTHPMYSSLLLTPDADGKDDGLLEAREIMQMDLRADLAVLSACETGRGHISAGEGVVGLAWAFFVAGTPTTVVSLWNVESVSTADLMLEFHRRLHAAARSGQDTLQTAESLRQAQLHLLHSSHTAHPFYWAGFSTVGVPN